EQVAAQSPGVRQRLLLAERCDERVQGEQPLGRPAPVDRGLADPGPGGDLFDRHRREPAFREQRHGRRQDRPVSLWAARPPSGWNIPAHRQVAPTGNPKRSVTYLIGSSMLAPEPPATRPSKEPTPEPTPEP